MDSISVKEFLSLKMPTEEQSCGDHQRILLALQALGYDSVTIPLSVLQRLYPLCRKADFDITVTLVNRQTDWVVTHVEAGDTRRQHYALAVDYGSTTIIMELIDLNSGTVIGQESCVNGQTAYGTDILTRITFSMESEENAGLLQSATVDTLHRLLAQLREATGIDARRLPAMILSGNTAMIHFLLKLDAWTVFASPYAPVTTDPGFLWGREVGMDFEGIIYILPAASNYVGGDIVSGLLTLDLHKQEEPAMFFDIGTNGELVIGSKDWLIAGAGAAGPALEGYISPFGMRAAPGAIDSVSIEGQTLHFTTIEGKKPVGICGSGIIDLVAQMRLAGWINAAGELEPEASSRIRHISGAYAVVYATEEESATGQPLFFSQTDMIQYLDTKAAAYTMIDSLLDTAGLDAAALRRCYLSGAFCAHADLESAIALGIFPDLPREKYTVLPNSSLAGAKAVLLDRSKLREATELSQNIHCLQFASIPDFLVRMQAAKFIPHTDMHRFPTVAEKLKSC